MFRPKKKDTLIGAAYVDKSMYVNREMLPDIYGKPDASLEKTLVQVKGNLYRQSLNTLKNIYYEPDIVKIIIKHASQ